FYGERSRLASCSKNWNHFYRWDLLRASRLRLGGGMLARGDLNLYAYLNDRHIDDALRSIVPPLKATGGNRSSNPEHHAGNAR
uniref:hypothetical protein n=1 Tax=Delftia tsuruhatensis TaxID=180282 RepID=UPI002028FF10